MPGPSISRHGLPLEIADTVTVSPSLMVTDSPRRRTRESMAPTAADGSSAPATAMPTPSAPKCTEVGGPTSNRAASSEMAAEESRTGWSTPGAVTSRSTWWSATDRTVRWMPPSTAIDSPGRRFRTSIPTPSAPTGQPTGRPSPADQSMPTVSGGHGSARRFRSGGQRRWWSAHVPGRSAVGRGAAVGFGQPGPSLVEHPDHLGLPGLPSVGVDHPFDDRPHGPAQDQGDGEPDEPGRRAEAAVEDGRQERQRQHQGGGDHQFRMANSHGTVTGYRWTPVTAGRPARPPRRPNAAGWPAAR